jgi:hypothetical protein
MGLTPAQARLYAQGHSDHDPDDKRFGTRHKRIRRGFVDIDYGKRCIRFYPINRWPEAIGVTNPTLREWIRRGMLVPTKVHSMYVLSKAEMVEVRKVVDAYGLSSKAHITDEIATKVRSAHAQVLGAYEYLRKLCKQPLPEHLRQLILPSLNDI